MARAHKGWRRWRGDMKTLHLADRFAVMVAHLAGEPVPPLPCRVHRAPVPTERDPYPEQQQREVQAAAVWRELASDGEGSAPD